MSEAATLSQQVLVLNRSFVPIHVTSLKRAFCMLYVGIAKVVDEEFQSFDFETWADLSPISEKESLGLVGKTIRIPRVILLQVYDRVPQKQVRFSRYNIYARDQNKCQYCGHTFAKKDLNLDHVIPRSQGGLTSWENIVCSCISCNRKKGGRTPLQASMKLLKRPQKPNWNESLRLSAKKGFHRAWKVFFNDVDFSYWNVELEQS